VFDPCIWPKGGEYYALSAGTVPFRPGGRHTAANYLFRSRDLVHWEYLHPFVEGDRFARLGDDGACPYFWPIGDRHVLVFFSHQPGEPVHLRIFVDRSVVEVFVNGRQCVAVRVYPGRPTARASPSSPAARNPASSP